MSKEIVPEICPPPEWNLTETDIHNMVDTLEETYERYQPAFERRDQAAHGWVYLKGLLSDLPRKVTERIALRFGKNVRSLQHFMGQSPWSCEPLRKIHQELVVETLGETDGVALIDESGMVKQGKYSVGVAWQWCGSVGKVANSQVGVYLGYASRKGHGFLDAHLYLPEQWLAKTHDQKRQDCGVPEELAYQTKPEIALDMLQNALDRGELPCKWVAADELYGDSPAFRDGVAALGKFYFNVCALAGVEVSCSTHVWQDRPEVHLPAWKGRGRKPTRLRLRNPEQKSQRVNVLAQELPSKAWFQAKIKEGAKGPMICDLAFLRVVEVRNTLPGPESWLIIRRSLADPSEIKYYLSNAPVEIELLELVRISGMRWPIETLFRFGKVEVGFDHYELRSWLGWHHHMFFAFLAHLFLVRMRIFFKERAPALTIYQVRLLLRSVLPMPKFTPPLAIRMVRYYQRRNYTAYLSHRRDRLRRLSANLAL